jgi:hypothetical protein
MRHRVPVIVLAAVLSVLLNRPCRGMEQGETGLFTFAFAPQDRTAALALMRRADAVAREVSDLLGFAVQQRMQVHIASDPESFARMQPAGDRTPDWAIGTAYPALNRIYLRRGRGIDLERTLRHEVSHILLGQAFGHQHRVPRWLDEGLAILLAREWNFGRLSTMTIAVLTDSLLPMDSIAERFPADLRSAELAYSQSYYFISFLKTRYGAERFHFFLREYSQIRDFNLALRKSYGLSWHMLEDEWHSYLRTRFSWIPILTSSGALWFAASLIFVWGYLVKRARTRRILQEWNREEEMLYGPDDGPPP